LVAVVLVLLLPVSFPEMLPDCPGFGTTVEEQLCALWRESVASIPYEVLSSVKTFKRTGLKCLVPHAFVFVYSC
jgi:hypothetical protein